MSKKPGDWWDRSWTLVEGCTWPDGEMPPACEQCWARGMARRFHQHMLEGVRCKPENLGLPLKTKKPTVFACQIQYGDLFHPEVPLDHVWAAFGMLLVEENAKHTFAFLTKRYLSAADRLSEIHRSGGVLRDGILLASVWDQKSIDEACEAFFQLPPGARWGLHVEPLLGPVELGPCFLHQPDPHSLSWIVVGGETGPRARPMHPDWVRTLRDQCQATAVPFWFKGWGGKRPRESGRLLDGREWNEVPW